MRPPLFALTLAAFLVGATACGSSSSSSSSKPNSPSSATGEATNTTSGAVSSPGTSTGGATATAPPVATTLHLAADPTGALNDKTKLTAKSGRVTIAMVNDSPVAHDIAVEGEGLTEQGPVVKNGGTSTLTVFLKPGTYTFFCNIDDHEAAGMKGTLTVQ